MPPEPSCEAWVATKSEGIELRVGGGPPKFLFVNVVPERPRCCASSRPERIRRSPSQGHMWPISIESRDDLGLASLALRYTKASGGGENLRVHRR